MSGLGRAIAGAAAAVLALTVAAGSASAAASLEYTVPTSAQLLGVAVEPSGEIVAAGQSAGNVFVERFTAGGSADGTYTGPAGYARAVTIAPNGDIVIAGSDGAMFVERLTSSLSPEWSASAFGGSAQANAVGITPGGAIVAAGSVGVGASQAAAVAEFTAGGQLASGLHSGGATLAGWGPYSAVEALAVQPDGKLVLAGQQAPGGNVTNAVLGRLNADGSPDTSFAADSADPYRAGPGYEIYYDANGAYTSFNGVAIQTNDQIDVAGVDSGPNALFARYSASGDPDHSFGTNGFETVPSAAYLNINAGTPVGANGIGLAGAGNIVGAGNYDYGGAEIDAALWTVGASGSPQATTLGPPTSHGSSPNYESCAVAVAPDGSIVTVGDNPTPPNGQPCANGVSSTGFLAKYSGYGPPPPPPQPQPIGGPPQVSTGGASSLTATSATLGGSVDPQGLQTTYYFRYGTTTAYGSSTPGQSAGNGTSSVPASATISGLNPDTTYHYQLVASNADGTTYGADASFTTAKLGSSPPMVQTGSATAVGEVSATIGGLVNAEGSATNYHFEYGTSGSYGSSTSITSVSGSSATAVQATLTKLQPNTTYHYRLVAANGAGSVQGADHTFTTQPRLAVSIRGVRASYRIGSVLAHGLTVKLSCSQPCSLQDALILGAAAAKRIGLGHHQIRLGRSTGRLPSGAVRRITLRIAPRFRRRLSRQRQLVISLQLAAAPLNGGPLHRTSKRITLKR